MALLSSLACLILSFSVWYFIWAQLLCCVLYALRYQIDIQMRCLHETEYWTVTSFRHEYEMVMLYCLWSAKFGQHVLPEKVEQIFNESKIMTCAIPFARPAICDCIQNLKVIFKPFTKNHLCQDLQHHLQSSMFASWLWLRFLREFLHHAWLSVRFWLCWMIRCILIAQWK